MSALHNFPPVIAVTGLAFEARIAAGPGVTVICGGDEQQMIAALEAAVTSGPSGVISFGTAGGLAPGLTPGQWVVAAAIITEKQKFPVDSRWSQKLLQVLPGAMHRDIAGVDGPVVQASAKSALHDRTGAAAADMESHIAASIALARGLPFAACRVIIDPASRSLPPAVLAAMRADRTVDIAAMFRSLAHRPSQLPALLRIARDAQIARTALSGGRRLLGPGLSFPDFCKL